MDFSLGLVEVSALGNAIKMLDVMLKTADVEFVATERKLGGRLVTIVIKGDLTGVQAAVDAGVEEVKRLECYKASNVIARPHEEILKFLHLDDEHEKKANSEYAGTHVGAIPRQNTRKRTASKAKAEEIKVPAKNIAEEVKPAPKRRGRTKKTN